MIDWKAVVTVRSGAVPVMRVEGKTDVAIVSKSKSGAVRITLIEKQPVPALGFSVVEGATLYW